jgi:hypothetical protein
MVNNERLVKKFYGVLAVLGIVSLALFRFLYPKDVRVLEEFDFSQGEWKLQKGYHWDNTQYVITDPLELESLKDEWVLSSADRIFGTTGGYCVSLFHDGKRVFVLDLIIDGEEDLSTPGFLDHNKIGCLQYLNLKWLEKGDWNRVNVGKNN